MPDAKSLALRRLAARGRGGDGLFPLAGAHPRHALARGPRDRGTRAFVSGAFQEFPGRGGRALSHRLPLRRAECVDGARCGARAEDWRWGSLWARRHGDERCKAILSDWPIERPSGLDEAGERADDGEGSWRAFARALPGTGLMETSRGKCSRSSGLGYCTPCVAKDGPRRQSGGRGEN